ncbi:MAG TPA: DUF72 domain-containing protein [Bacteroidota bacterium]|nr:DUF72 domain-containing protein [Bacteroidota bacterium]
MSKTIHIGMGGWDLVPFDGRFYPATRTKGFRKLAYYSHFFDLVEINSTFYNTAFSPAQIGKWLEDIAENPEFMFTVKLFRGFTHTFDATNADALAVNRLAGTLASVERFGGLLIQFPLSFANTPDHRDYLAHLASAFNTFRMFLEVRHNSWNSAAMYDFFRELKFHPVNVDLPRIGRHIPFNTLAYDGAAYFRLMGRNSAAWRNPWRKEEDGKHMVSDRYRYQYSDQELGEIALAVKQAGSWNDTKFVVFHNDPEANSVYNGFRLRKLISPRSPIRVPRRTITAFPSLAEFATPV